MDDLLTKSQVSGMNIYTSVYQFFGVAIQASKCVCASTKVNLHGPPNDGCNNKHSYFGLYQCISYPAVLHWKLQFNRGNGWASSHHQPLQWPNTNQPKPQGPPNRSSKIELDFFTCRVWDTRHVVTSSWWFQPTLLINIGQNGFIFPKSIFGVNIKQIVSWKPPPESVFHKRFGARVSFLRIFPKHTGDFLGVF